MSRDWQEDMDIAHTARHEGKVGMIDFNNILDALFYWIQQYNKQTKDKADLLIQKYADANTYQVQAVEIGELRKQLEIANLAYEGLSEDSVTRGEYESLLQKHTVMTKSRWEEKERADGTEGKSKFWKIEYHALLREFTEYRTLYPLEREDTTNDR